MSHDLHSSAPPSRPPFKFRSLAPTIFRPVILRTLLFMVFFVGSLTWILALVSPSYLRNPSDEIDQPAYLMMATFLALALNYLGCSLISQTLFGFGVELRTFSLFSSTRLWPLAVRMLVFPITMAIVGAPALAVLLVYANGSPLSNPWLFSINLMLLHGFFCIGAAFVGITPTFNRVLQILIKAALPFRILSSAMAIGSFWVLFFIFQLIRAMFELWADAILITMRHLAALADSLFHVTAIGPLILFWLNPYYLLVKLHSTDSMGISAQASFAALCLLASVAMAVRLRTWLVIDLDERSHDMYEEWLQIRNSIPLEHPENFPLNQQQNPSLYTAGHSSEDPYTDTGPSDQLAAQPHDHVSPPTIHYQLPADTTAESYVDSLLPQYKTYPHIIFTGMIIAAVMFALIYSAWIVVIAIGLWLLVTSVNLWNIPRAANLIPLRVAPTLQKLFRQRLMPLLPFDAAFAILIALLLNAPWHNVIPFTLLLAGVRPVALSLAIAYVMQGKIATTLCVMLGLGYVYIGIFSINVNADPHLPWVVWLSAGIACIFLALSGLVALWQLSRSNWLQHTEGQ